MRPRKKIDWLFSEDQAERIMEMLERLGFVLDYDNPHVYRQGFNYLRVRERK